MGTTIDLTPTWAHALRICLTVLEDGTPEGKKEARKHLADMAKVADAHAAMFTNVKVQKHNAIITEDKDGKPTFHLKLSDKQMYILADALSEYCLLSGREQLEKRAAEHKDKSNLLRVEINKLFNYNI